MNETLEQIARRIADGVPIIESNEDDAWLLEYSKRFAAALGAQEPVAEAQNGGVVLWAGMYPAAGTELYAAPVVKEGWQMVPKEPTPEMCKAADELKAYDNRRGAITLASNIYRDMLAAAPEYKP